jgi:hypothetical protein
MVNISLYALPFPALMAGQGEIFFMSHHKGKAGQKKLPCDGLLFLHFNTLNII